VVLKDHIWTIEDHRAKKRLRTNSLRHCKDLSGLNLLSYVDLSSSFELITFPKHSPSFKLLKSIFFSFKEMFNLFLFIYIFCRSATGTCSWWGWLETHREDDSGQIFWPRSIVKIDSSLGQPVSVIYCKTVYLSL